MCTGVISDMINFSHNTTMLTTEHFLVHRHAVYELLYFVRGNVDFLVEGREYAMKPNTIMLFPPNILHGVRVNSQAEYERYALHFNSNTIAMQRRSLLAAIYPSQGKLESKAVVYENADEFPIQQCLDVLGDFGKICPQPNAEQSVLASIMLEAVLAQTCLLVQQRLSLAQNSELPENRKEVKGGGRAYGSIMPGAIEEIITYMNDNIARPITLDSLCTRFYISKHYLNRAFRKATGTTVMDYLIHKRIIYAQQLLINGVSATEAAGLVGFADYTTFYRAYKKVLGHAPSTDRGERPGTLNQPFIFSKFLEGSGSIEVDDFDTE